MMDLLRPKPKAPPEDSDEVKLARKGNTTVGVKGKQVLVLGAVRRPRRFSGLREDVPSAIRALDRHVMLATSGMESDGRLLYEHTYKHCQEHQEDFLNPMSLSSLADFIAFKQTKGFVKKPTRSLAIYCLIAGFEKDGSTRLYQTDPNGAAQEWKAIAVGTRANEVVHFLKHTYGTSDTLFDEDATVRLAVTCLMSADGAAKNMDVAILKRGRPMQMLSEAQVDWYVRRIESDCGLPHYNAGGGGQQGEECSDEDQDSERQASTSKDGNGDEDNDDNDDDDAEKKKSGGGDKNSTTSSSNNKSKSSTKAKQFKDFGNAKDNFNFYQ